MNIATSTIQLETIQGLTFAVDVVLFLCFVVLVFRLFWK